MATVVITIEDGEGTDVKVSAEFDPPPPHDDDGAIRAETGAQAAALLVLSSLQSID